MILTFAVEAEGLVVPWESMGQEGIKNSILEKIFNLAG